MNYYKIQSDILKLLVQQKNGPCFAPASADQEPIMSDGKFLAVIPKEKCFISVTNPKQAVLALRDFLNDFYNPNYNYLLAKRKYQLNAKPAASNKTMPVERLDSESATAYVAIKYLKYFDSDACYYIHSRKALVFVMEQDVLVGAICPVNIIEEDT